MPLTSPRTYENIWKAHGYRRWAMEDSSDEDITGIDSPRNELLLFGDVHTMFDAWKFAINPDVSSFLSRVQCLRVICLQNS